MTQGKHSLLVRLFAARPRLLISAAVGVLVVVLIPDTVRMTSRLLVGWDIAALLYLAFVTGMIRRASIDTIKKRAALYDEGGLSFLFLALLAVASSFVAIFAELAHTKANIDRDAGSIILAGITVVLSWSLTHVMFALHYAHLYYRDGHAKGSGILMPEQDQPDYSDFMYFSFVIGCASQTADISSTTRTMRRVMTVHGIVSFFFNAAILALTINIAASLV